MISAKEEGKGIFTITALRHDPDKFEAVENDVVLAPKDYSQLTLVTDPPHKITATESLYQAGTDIKAKVTVSWDKVDRAVSYILRYKKDDDNFVDLPENQFNDIDVLDVQPGTYTFDVSAINSVGKVSQSNRIVKEIFGKTAPPLDVENFSMIPNAGQAYLTWTQASDLDVLVGGQIRIRHTPDIVDQDWANAIDIVPAMAGTATSCLAPLLAGTYMAKFVDSSGNLSVNAVEIVTTIPYANALNVVQTID